MSNYWKIILVFWGWSLVNFLYQEWRLRDVTVYQIMLGFVDNSTGRFYWRALKILTAALVLSALLYWVGIEFFAFTN